MDHDAHKDMETRAQYGEHRQLYTPPVEYTFLQRMAAWLILSAFVCIFWYALYVLWN